MAHQEPAATASASHDATAHVRDYARFTKMVKWGAVTAAIIGLIVLMILG